MTDEILHEIDQAINSLETLWRTKKRRTKKRMQMEQQIYQELENRIGREQAEKYWPGINQAAQERL